jgi:hypothetical protein
MLEQSKSTVAIALYEQEHLLIANDGLKAQCLIPRSASAVFNPNAVGIGRNKRSTLFF